MSLEKIGINAGLVWVALENGELNVKAVKKATKLTEKDLNLLLWDGWRVKAKSLSKKENCLSL